MKAACFALLIPLLQKWHFEGNNVLLMLRYNCTSNNDERNTFGSNMEAIVTRKPVCEDS